MTVLIKSFVLVFPVAQPIFCHVQSAGIFASSAFTPGFGGMFVMFIL